MAVLQNRSASLQVVIEPAIQNADGVVARVAVEYLDRRDGQFWPVLALPVVRLKPGALGELREVVRSVTAGAPSGAWQGGLLPDVVLKLEREGTAGFVIELGLDLGAFLQENSGKRGAPGSELSLFRFPTALEALVTFADALT